MLKALKEKIENLENEELAALVKETNINISAIEIADKKSTDNDGSVVELTPATIFDDDLFKIYYIESEEEIHIQNANRIEMEEILFRAILAAYGTEPKKATWCFNNPKKCECIATIMEYFDDINNYSEALSVAAERTQKELSKLQAELNTLEMVNKNYSKTYESEKELRKEINKLKKSLVEVGGMEVVLFIEDAEITNSNELEEIVEPSDYVFDNKVGVIGQRNVYRFLIKRDGDLKVVETDPCYGSREVSNNGELMGQEWYDLPLQKGDIVLGVRGEERYSDLNGVEGFNSFKYIFKSPIIWDWNAQTIHKIKKEKIVEATII